jgi:hypothetical protein
MNGDSELCNDNSGKNDELKKRIAVPFRKRNKKFYRYFAILSLFQMDYLIYMYNILAVNQV